MFKNKVISVVKNIPKGETMSYAEVASLAGSPRACRAVGTILAQNKDTSIPCHRVIRSNGTLGKYNGLQGSKSELLRLEREP